jgi:two-component system sensor histidine kinase MprB
MNLQRRVALTLGLIPTVMVLVFGAVSLLFTVQSLRSTTDAELLQGGELFSMRISEGRDEDIEAFLLEDEDVPAPSVRLLARDGSVLVGSDDPLSADALAVATQRSDEPLFETVQNGDQHQRILTMPVDGEEIGAVQIGRDITDIANGLRRSRTGTLIAGLLAGLASAGIGWGLSKRLVAPVRAVADAADRLRTDAHLPDRIDGEGTDDLGRLITSFNQMLGELQHSRQQQQRLVADASHELRTPLTSLRVKTEFLQSQPDLPAEERQRLLDGTVAELESLSTLVTELVGLAADGTTPDEPPSLIDLASVITSEAERFRVSTGRTVEVSTTPGMVETRQNQVVRALSNLLVNADKYTPADSPIEISQRGNRIEVRDHGPGIPMDERGRVFDRFHRGGNHQSIDGNGLGLAIVDSVAQTNGGTTWISTPPEGKGVIVGLSVGPSAEVSG